MIKTRVEFVIYCVLIESEDLLFIEKLAEIQIECTYSREINIAYRTNSGISKILNQL